MSRSRMVSTTLTRRGWVPKTMRASAAARALAMCHAKPRSSPTPATRATLPDRLMGIMDGGLLHRGRVRDWSSDSERAGQDAGAVQEGANHRDTEAQRRHREEN